MRAIVSRKPKLKAPPEPLHFRDLLALFPRALKATADDGCIGYAKGAAYSALLAFFPLLAGAATILVHAKADWVAETVSSFLARVLPPDTEDLVFNYFAVRGQKPILLPVTAMLLSISAASGATVSLMQGFTACYRIPTNRPFVRERIVGVLLIFSVAIPALFASALMLLGVHAERWIGRWLGLLPQGVELQGWLSVAAFVARYLVSVSAIVLGASILYYYGPNRPQRWRLVWPGAVVATVLWLGTTLVFGWYVRNIAHYNVVYGSFAAVILLEVWMFMLAVIAFIGCEFNAVYERAAGHSV